MYLYSELQLCCNIAAGQPGMTRCDSNNKNIAQPFFTVWSHTTEPIYCGLDAPLWPDFTLLWPDFTLHLDAWTIGTLAGDVGQGGQRKDPLLCWLTLDPTIGHHETRNLHTESDSTWQWTWNTFRMPSVFLLAECQICMWHEASWESDHDIWPH